MEPFHRQAGPLRAWGAFSTEAAAPDGQSCQTGWSDYVRPNPENGAKGGGGLMVGLGLLGRLERTLATTNPIEKLHGITRAMTGRVKRCRNGAMALCCVAAGLLARDSAASGATARCPG